MQEQLLQYKILPISQEHHSCSLNSLSLLQAYTPSPYKGSGHLGMHKITINKNKTKIDCWQMP
uniref:Uncharacterized protein n=1 Tax=Salvator merianae TaxID=96440 RepID=A0A8D0DSW5_SALMN